MLHVYVCHISTNIGDQKMKKCEKKKNLSPEIYKSGGYYGTISPKDFK